MDRWGPSSVSFLQHDSKVVIAITVPFNVCNTKRKFAFLFPELVRLRAIMSVQWEIGDSRLHCLTVAFASCCHPLNHATSRVHYAPDKPNTLNKVEEDNLVMRDMCLKLEAEVAKLRNLLAAAHGASPSHDNLSPQVCLARRRGEKNRLFVWSVPAVVSVRKVAVSLSRRSS